MKSKLQELKRKLEDIGRTLFELDAQLSSFRISQHNVDTLNEQVKNLMGDVTRLIAVAPDER